MGLSVPLLRHQKDLRSTLQNLSSRQKPLQGLRPCMPHGYFPSHSKASKNLKGIVHCSLNKIPRKPTKFLIELWWWKQCQLKRKGTGTVHKEMRSESPNFSGYEASGENPQLQTGYILWKKGLLRITSGEKNWVLTKKMAILANICLAGIRMAMNQGLLSTSHFLPPWMGRISVNHPIPVPPPYVRCERQLVF